MGVSETGRTEVKVVIAGITFLEDKIESLTIEKNLLGDKGLAIGMCNSAQLDVSVWTDGKAIPKAAKIEPFVRTVNGTNVGAWIPKGVFYVSERAVEFDGNKTTFHAYDSMRKASVKMIPDGESIGQWPLSMREVANEIAERIDVELEDETTVSNTYEVGYPSDYTMLELMSHIAAAHGGNWIITDKNKLRLVKVGDIPTETFRMVTEVGDPIQIGDDLIRG